MHNGSCSTQARWAVRHSFCPRHPGSLCHESAAFMLHRSNLRCGNHPTQRHQHGQQRIREDPDSTVVAVGPSTCCNICRSGSPNLASLTRELPIADSRGGVVSLYRIGGQALDGSTYQAFIGFACRKLMYLINDALSKSATQEIPERPCGLTNHRSAYPAQRRRAHDSQDQDAFPIIRVS